MQKSINHKGFTLVELLVVITILSILSVVAYQNFGGATDKAISARKMNDISTIETALQQFHVEYRYYPMPLKYDDSNNVWGYNSTREANSSNTMSVKYDGAAIESLSDPTSFTGGGKIMGLMENETGTEKLQIGAKGTMGIEGDFSRNYLSKDLYDPELGDIKIKNSGDSNKKKMIDYGIGRYVYSVYAKPAPSSNWNTGQNLGSAYNIATTLKGEDGETYISYVTGDYDRTTCKEDFQKDCPDTLIGSASGTSGSVTGYIEDGQKENGNNTLNANQGIPYPLNNFTPGS